MATELSSADAEPILRHLKMFAVGVVAFFTALVVYAVYLDQRIDTLNHSSPGDLDHEEQGRSDLYHLAANPVEGQTVYVPAYSHIYHGLQGVQCLSQHRGEIVAVLLDLAMPQMDGVEALEALREIEDIPILLMSGYPEADVMRQVSGQAVAGFVEKPYRPETLLRTIRQVLGL